MPRFLKKNKSEKKAAALKAEADQQKILDSDRIQIQNKIHNDEQQKATILKENNNNNNIVINNNKINSEKNEKCDKSDIIIKSENIVEIEIKDDVKDLPQPPKVKQPVTTNPLNVYRKINLELTKNQKQQKANHTNRSAPLLAEVRTKLTEAFEREPNLYYEQDINKVMTDDWYLKRYLLVKRRNVPQTVQMVTGALQLRKQYGFRDYDWSYFPIEMHALGALFAYAPDKEGNLTLYFRINMLYKEEFVQKLVKLYAGKFLCEIEEFVQSPITCIVDLKGTGWNNADFDLLFFALNILTRYTPAVVRRILIVDVPWIFRTMIKTVQRFLPSDQAKFLKAVSSADLLRDHVDPENAPDYIEGGLCKIPYRGVEMAPPDSVYMLDFVMNYYPHLSIKKLLKLSRFYLPLLEDAERMGCEVQRNLTELYSRILERRNCDMTFDQLIQEIPELEKASPERRQRILLEIANKELHDDLQHESILVS